MSENSQRPWWRFWHQRPAPTGRIDQILDEAKTTRETLERHLRDYNQATRPDHLAALVRESMKGPR